MEEIPANVCLSVKIRIGKSVNVVREEYFCTRNECTPARERIPDQVSPVHTSDPQTVACPQNIEGASRLHGKDSAQLESFEHAPCKPLVPMPPAEANRKFPDRVDDPDVTNVVIRIPTVKSWVERIPHKIDPTDSGV